MQPHHNKTHTIKQVYYLQSSLKHVHVGKTKLCPSNFHENHKEFLFLQVNKTKRNHGKPAKQKINVRKVICMSLPLNALCMYGKSHML